MRKIFFGSLAIFFSATAAALPLKIWEAGGQFRDVHVQDYSTTSPNTNSEKTIVYANSSADSAGFLNNLVRITDPINEGIYPVQRVYGPSGPTITPGSTFEFMQLDFYNWDLLEGSEALDLRVMFNYFDTSLNQTASKRVDLSFLLNFDVINGGTSLVNFTPAISSTNFVINGENYNLSFDSVCKTSISATNCVSDQTWLSLDASNNKFSFFATLTEDSVTSVPEPSSLSILFAGLAICALARRKKMPA